MKLLKKTNYPAYTVDNVDDMVLKDSNGVPLICSHEFNKLESGMHVKKWRKQDIHFGDAPTWYVAIVLPVLQDKRSPNTCSNMNGI